MASYEEGSEDLYESDDGSLAEEVDEATARDGAGGAAAADDSDDDDPGAWEMRPADDGAARGERRHDTLLPAYDEQEEEEERWDEEGEEEDEDDDAARVVRGLQQRQQEGRLTARQRAALNEPGSGAAAAALDFPEGLPEALSKGTKRKAEDTLVVAQRKEEAKLRVKAAKEQQLKEAREAATAKILSGDTSRKKQAAKAQKEQEERLAARRADVPPQPGFVRIKRGPTGGVVAFAAGEGPYWAA